MSRVEMKVLEMKVLEMRQNLIFVLEKMIKIEPRVAKLKLSDVIKILQDSLRTDEDNKKTI